MRRHQWPFLFLACLFSFRAKAANDFKRIEDCGSANIVSGDTCSNVKVEFKFEGCQFKSQSQIAKKILCEKNTVKALYQSGAYRYEAEFLKENDSWGSVSWKPLGSVKQWQKEFAVAKTPPPRQDKRNLATTPVAPEIAATPTPLPPPQLAQPPQAPENGSPFKFSAFFDFRYTNFSVKDDPLVANANSESGFGLEDGAFYVNYEKDRLSTIVDIAFRRGKDVDLNSAAAKPNQSSNSNLAIGVDKSQVFLKYKLTTDLILDFGQFDTIYGVEVNDSKDRIFGKTGLVYDLTLPVTHTGMMLEYSTHGFYGKALAANPNNKGSNGTSTTGDEKTEYGGALGYSNDTVRFQLGYMGRPISKADNTGFGNRSMLDLTAGLTVGAFSLDAEYSKVDDPSKNTLSAADSSDRENAGQGFLALATYKVSEPLLFGIRYEQIKDDPASLGIDSANSYGGSIHYKMRPDLELRTEYVGYKFKHLSGPSSTDSRFNIAALLLF